MIEQKQAAPGSQISAEIGSVCAKDISDEQLIVIIS